MLAKKIRAKARLFFFAIASSNAIGVDSMKLFLKFNKNHQMFTISENQNKQKLNTNTIKRMTIKTMQSVFHVNQRKKSHKTVHRRVQSVKNFKNL